MGEMGTSTKRAAGAACGDEREDAGREARAASVLERMIARRDVTAPPEIPFEIRVAAWSEEAGTLGDGTAARRAASCLLRPAPGDRVLAWRAGDGRSWVLAVLECAQGARVIGSDAPVTIEAPRIGLVAGAVHIAADDLLTSTRHRHAVEETRTETARVRVAQIGTDVRRATTVHDTVEGTLAQRAGTWLANTVREARLRARAFLFD